MTSKRSFKLIYDSELTLHLRSIERKYHSLIRQTIEEQLRHEPDVESRNRKPLIRKSKFGATSDIPGRTRSIYSGNRGQKRKSTVYWWGEI